jgi:hypothetical protein
VSENIYATAQCWAMAQRVGVTIAALPPAAREAAFDGTERCLRAAGSELGVAGEQLDASLTFKCGLFGKSSLTLTLTMVPQPRK